MEEVQGEAESEGKCIRGVERGRGVRREDKDYLETFFRCSAQKKRE